KKMQIRQQEAEREEFVSDTFAEAAILQQAMNGKPEGAIDLPDVVAMRLVQQMGAAHVGGQHDQSVICGSLYPGIMVSGRERQKAAATGGVQERAPTVMKTVDQVGIGLAIRQPCQQTYDRGQRPVRERVPVPGARLGIVARGR